MKVKYDKETDILYIRLSDLAIAESDEEKKALYWIIQLTDNWSELKY